MKSYKMLKQKKCIICNNYFHTYMDSVTCDNPQCQFNYRELLRKKISYLLANIVALAITLLELLNL